MNAGSLLVLTLLASPDGAGAGEASTLVRLAAVQDDGGAESGGAESGGAESGGAESGGAESSTDAADASGGGADEGEAKDGEEEECKVAIMNLQSKGLPPDQKHVATLLTDTMAAEIQAQDSCKVVTQSDIMQMLDFEASKAAVCTDESDSCLAEIGGALGVDRVIGGSVGMLGSSFKLQVKLQNVREGRVEARVDELIKGEPELLDAAARNAARRFFGGEPIVVAASQKGESQDDAPAEAGAASEDEEGGFLGLALLGAGGLVGGLSVVGLLGGVLAAVAGQVLFTNTGLGASERNTFKSVGRLGLGVAVIASLFVVIGAGVGAVGLVVE